jgi:hypothetical protein
MAGGIKLKIAVKQFSVSRTEKTPGKRGFDSGGSPASRPGFSESSKSP